MRAGIENANKKHEPAGGNPFAVTTPQPSVFVPPEPARLADLFPQLEILELLGHGGMGAVYKARQTNLDRVVALKIVRPESADDPMFRVRFDREAKTLARLSHPNIVGIYDFGDVEYSVDDGEAAGALYYFLMEYVDGINLRQLIQTGETTSEQALPIVLQICEALQYAHDQGVVHRDIKPENILLDATGRLKIADFGLAKLGREADDLQLTGTRQVLGTVQYMAPEQMTQSKTVDHRADIYSMGVVFYEMLTGDLPVGAFERPSQLAAVDVRLDEVVMKTLATNPKQRYQNASDVGSHISSIASSETSADRSQKQAYRPGPSTIMENGVAALAAGMNRMLSPAEAEDDLGRTDVTLTLEQIKSDRLPDVCIVCGKATRRRLGREFEHMSERATWLMVLLFVVFFPAGIVAAILLKKKVRASIPVCARDSSHWSRLAWFASLGWLLIPLGVLIAFWLVDFKLAGGPETAIFVGCVLFGIAIYVIPLVYLGTTRISVENIADTTITLKRVSGRFAREVAQMHDQSGKAADRERVWSAKQAL
jgi:serine/threonine protein kinase